MASRKGSLLESSVYQLLKLSGFRPELNKTVNGYEIDIFLSYRNLKIAFECKQYEKGSLAVRNLIHQWDSKNRELKFDKLVLVLIGTDISEAEYQLAKKYNIVIWDEAKFHSLSNRAIKKRIKNKNAILKELEISKSKGVLITKKSLKPETNVNIPEESEPVEDVEIEVDLKRKPQNSWLLWVVGIFILILIFGRIPSDSNKKDYSTEELTQPNFTIPTVIETSKLVTVRYWNVSINLSSFNHPTINQAGILKSYEAGELKYPLGVFNYDGEICRRNPKDCYIEDRHDQAKERGNISVVLIGKDDFIVIMEDPDCRQSNETIWKNCVSPIHPSNRLQDIYLYLRDSRLGFLLLNETVENRTYLVKK